MKLFRTGSVALVEDFQRFLNFLPASYQVNVKTVKFVQKYKGRNRKTIVYLLAYIIYFLIE